MKTIISIFTLICIVLTGHGQDLKFGHLSPLSLKEKFTDRTIPVTFSLENAVQDCDLTVKVNEEKTSATIGRDYVLPLQNPYHLTAANGYQGHFDFTIRADLFTEAREDVTLTFSYPDQAGVNKEIEYVLYLFDLNDSTSNDPQYTPEESQKNKRLSFEIFTGGTLDFFDNLRFQDIGGEFHVNANDIAGKDNRWGGFLGVSNFQNFSIDSSRNDVRMERVRVDTTGPYINGQTRYSEGTFVDHTRVSINQWSYYINPTWRINRQSSDFFNMYLSLRLEALRTATTTSFITDTLYTDVTNRPLGENPVFQTGKGIIPKSVTEVHTNGFYSIGVPMFLNSKDKFKLYFDPNIGLSKYTFSSYVLNESRISLSKILISQLRAFYLFRLRITEQLSGLGITVGGEIRGFLPSYEPIINLYIGVRANISTLLRSPVQ
ncbi:hypothetical protein [Pedobacter hartonius]|uniref:Uncharacterized protein n=1 Tax=Pedobacter hartonius TaxID=425514 RepID=A0A1H4D185_9SPHI|nr:hypothetical protein [Pedobacter hartonius]SEA66348.1 hypothetical protein SAMN05443550_104281 [Pedobacter hartonius]